MEIPLFRELRLRVGGFAPEAVLACVLEIVSPLPQQCVWAGGEDQDSASGGLGGNVNFTTALCCDPGQLPNVSMLDFLLLSDRSRDISPNCFPGMWRG